MKIILYTGVNAIDIAAPNKKTAKQLLAASFGVKSFPRTKRISASLTIIVENGITMPKDVINKSIVPYSAVVNTYVYNGTIKKVNILLPKLPTAKIAVLYTNFL